MTSQLLIGAKRWEPSGSSLGHCGNNALAIITRSTRYHITYTKKGALTPLEAQVHVWCPRRDSKGLRFAKPRASGARRPRHAPLQTGHRPVCLTLRVLTRVRHEKGGLDPLERSLACMVPEARIRTTLKKGGLLLGYNPRAPGSRLKARARTSSRPSAS